MFHPGLPLSNGCRSFMGCTTAPLTWRLAAGSADTFFSRMIPTLQLGEDMISQGAQERRAFLAGQDRLLVCPLLV